MGKEGKGNSIPKDNSLLNKRKRVPLEEIDAKQNVKKKQRLIVKKNLKGIEKKKKGVKIPPRKKIEVEIEAEKQQLFHKRKQILTALKKALSSKTQNTKKTIKNLNVQLSTLNPDTASDEDKKKIEQFQKKLKNQTNSLEVLKSANLETEFDKWETKYKTKQLSIDESNIIERLFEHISVKPLLGQYKSLLHSISDLMTNRERIMALPNIDFKKIEESTDDSDEENSNDDDDDNKEDLGKDKEEKTIEESEESEDEIQEVVDEVIDDPNYISEDEGDFPTEGFTISIPGFGSDQAESESESEVDEESDPDDIAIPILEKYEESDNEESEGNDGVTESDSDDEEEEDNDSTKKEKKEKLKKKKNRPSQRLRRQNFEQNVQREARAAALRAAAALKVENAELFKSHPSWEAKKKQTTITHFSGKKISFDDDDGVKEEPKAVKEIEPPKVEKKGAKKQDFSKKHPSWIIREELKKKPKAVITEFKGKKMTFDD